MSSALYGSIYQYKFLIDNNDVNQFVTSEGLKNFLANNSDFKFIKTENPAIFDVYMPFKSDRPFRNLLEEFFEKKIHKIVHISKINTLAKEGEKVGSYFEIFKIFADIHKDLI